MSKRHYSKAPIIEAVIDIQVTLPSDFSDASFVALADKLKGKFPIHMKIATIQMQLGGGVDDEAITKVSSTQNELGIRLADNLNSRVLQLKKTGFSYRAPLILRRTRLGRLVLIVFSGFSAFLHFEALILCQSRLFLDRFCHFTPQQTQLSRLV